MGALVTRPSPSKSFSDSYSSLQESSSSIRSLSLTASPSSSRVVNKKKKRNQCSNSNRTVLTRSPRQPKLTKELLSYQNCNSMTMPRVMKTKLHRLTPTLQSVKKRNQVPVYPHLVPNGLLL